MCSYIGGCLFACSIDGGYCIAGKKTKRRFEKEDARHVEQLVGLQAALGKMRREKRVAGLRRPEPPSPKASYQARELTTGNANGLQA
jgi:hypothetical protein